jgi:hypothetical protein
MNVCRQWFRFSLRTLFVVVTAMCIAGGWVAYQLNWIRQRHEFIAEVKKLSQPFYVPVWAYIRSDYVGPPYLPETPAPWPLRIFGEEGVWTIGIFDAGYLSYVERAKRLFPEADVGVSPNADKCFLGDPRY